MIWTLTRGSGLGSEDCQQHGNYCNCIMSTLLTLILPQKYFTMEHVRNEEMKSKILLYYSFIHIKIS